MHPTDMSRAKSYYVPDFLEKQRLYYQSLPEKQRRHFLAMEYERLGEGSQLYLTRVFNCGRDTIAKGRAELAECDYQPDYFRQRKDGGRKKKKFN